MTCHAMTPHRESFEQIIRDLATLRAAVPGVLESDAAEFQCSAVMTEAEVLEFERAHAVRLPEEYRAFLMCVGRGGAGPGYGLFDLGECDEGFDFRAWHEGDGFVGALRLPFPHSAAWNDMRGMPEDALSETDAAAYEVQRAAFEEGYFAPLDGAIPICHLGCALRQWLIVSGPEAGHVWEDRRADYEGLVPLQTPAGERAGFYAWYRGWLDEEMGKLGR
ncbi:MAG: SMI1/KNR4 family protein [Verrucomicrobia bacterium]|nr:SMI1/KNR4 family protein [Verrucomicrobiota bacterium]